MRLVVIGGVAAGLSAAARARRLDPSLDIVVLEKGETISYSACGLPYYLEGRVRRGEDLVVYTPEYFRQERRIDVRTRAAVASISHPRREVSLAGGEKVRYDRLVLATGARPERAIAGADLPHVFTLHTLADAENLKAFLANRRPRRAVVIGAGYIGLEAAEALRRNGLAVTVVEASPHVLQRQDPELSQAVVRHLERFHIEVRLGVRVKSVEDYPADVVVLAAGLKPSVELAQEAGVRTGGTGAVAVDDRMQTNQPGVYAAGDCAECTHLVTGRPVWIPLGTTANKMGRVAGANAAGARERFPGVVGTSIVSICGLGVGMTGLSVAEARREGFSPAAARIEAPAKARYFRGRPTTVELIADRGSGKLLGGAVTGEQGVAGRINVITAALHTGLRVDELDQMDLAYAPPFAPVWDPLLIAAGELRKVLGDRC